MANKEEKQWRLLPNKEIEQVIWFGIFMLIKIKISPLYEGKKENSFLFSTLVEYFSQEEDSTEFWLTIFLSLLQ